MRNFKLILLMEGILSICLAVLMFYVFDLSSSIFILFLPIDAVGKGLRFLSLSSTLGNILALFLYVFLSMLPFLYLIRKKLKTGLTKIDFLLPVISIFSFYMIYEFINPKLMLKRVPAMVSMEGYIPMAKLSFSITFYALLLGYIILRLLDQLKAQASQDKLGYLCTQLGKILIIISTGYTFVLGYFTAFQLFGDLTKKTGEIKLPMNTYFIIISYIINALPVIFAILTILAGIALLQAMVTDHMQEREQIAAAALGQISKKTVYITVFCNISLNLLQFLFSRMLNDTSYSLELSLFPLVIAASAMILSGFFKETKELHEDNEMII